MSNKAPIKVRKFYFYSLSLHIFIVGRIEFHFVFILSPILRIITL